MSVKFGDSVIGAEMNSASLNADFASPSITVRFNAPAISVGSAPQRIGGDPYAGPYEVTPTQSTQTLSTNGKTMSADVVVKPIPSCYGLITWNGAVLTVS